MTLGNQLGDSEVADKEVYEAKRAKYPNQQIRYIDAE